MLKRAWLSFAAMAAGWLFPSLAYVVWAAVAHEGVESALALAFWTGIFVFVAWLVIALPIALFVSPGNIIFRRGVAPIFGAVVGFASMSWTISRGLDGFLLAAYALVVGLVAGAVYAWLLGPRTVATAVRATA
jgi:hypothetical protein